MSKNLLIYNKKYLLRPAYLFIYFQLMFAF